VRGCASFAGRWRVFGADLVRRFIWAPESLGGVDDVGAASVDAGGAGGDGMVVEARIGNRAGGGYFWKKRIRRGGSVFAAAICCCALMIAKMRVSGRVVDRDLHL
jgi:hypothetical protein